MNRQRACMTMVCLAIAMMTPGSLGFSESAALTTLATFAVPYADLEGRGFARPAVSLSQTFLNADAMSSSVATAFPVLVPRRVAWDVRALKMDVMIGRREKGSSSIFEFDWDATTLLRDAPASLSLYDDCAGLPCSEPIMTLRNMSTSATNGDGLDVERYDWGNLYRVGVFVSRVPNVPGLRLDTSEIWLVYSVDMPRFYTDAAFEQPYELHHWLPVWASSSSQKDLAVRDFGNFLGGGWTAWQRGHDLQFALYEGLAYPSPGYVVVGYARDPDDPIFNHTAHPLPPSMPHTAAPPSTGSGQSAPGEGGLGAGIVVLLVTIGTLAFGVLGMCLIGLYRHRKRARDRRLGLRGGYRNSDDDSESLFVSNDGHFRVSSAESLGRPMQHGQLNEDDDEAADMDSIPVSNIDQRKRRIYDDPPTSPPL